MKKDYYKYTVYYLNDIQQDFYTTSVLMCYCLAVTDAALKEHDTRIKYIYDEENKTTYSSFELNFKTDIHP